MKKKSFKLYLAIGLFLCIPFSLLVAEKEWKVQKKLYDAIVKDDIKTIESILTKNPSLAKKQIKYHNLPILDAAQAGSLKAIKLLVDKGADIKQNDRKSGNNVIHMFLMSKPKNKELDQALDYFINEKKMKLEEQNKDKKTPFVYAFSYSQFTPQSKLNIPIIEVFTKYKANLNAQDNKGKTALHYLVSGFNCPGKIDLVKECTAAILLAEQKGVNVNITDKDKRTPLVAFLVQTKNVDDAKKIELVACLMQNGAKTNIKSKKGEKALKFVDKKSELYKVLKKKIRKQAKNKR